MNEDGRLRLFVAAELPEPVRGAIEVSIAPWRRRMSGFRWSAVENLHLTIAFIGQVASADLPDIGLRLERAAAVAAPCATALGRLGRFPERGRARVLWAGIDDPQSEVAAVAGVVVRALEGFLTPDERPFRAHVTVARARQPTALPEAFLTTSLEPMRFRIDRIALVRSHLSGDEPQYEALQRWHLGAPRP